MSTLKTNNIQHVDRSEPSIIIDTSGSVSIAGTLTYEDVTNVDSVGIITARGLSIFGNTTGLQVASGISTFQAVTATTGTFSGQVRVSDGSTSVPSIAASSDTNSGLYFAGADALGLVVGGSRKLLANSSGVAINNGDLTIDDKIIHQADTNTAIRFPAADTITAETGGSERVRINSSGNVGLGGQTNPSSALHIQDLSAHGYELKLGGNAITFNRTSLSYIDQINDTGSIVFRTTSSQTERVRIASDGQLTVDKGAPGSSNQTIARFQAASSRALDIVWHDTGSLMGFDTPGNHSYIFKTNGTERARLTSGGTFGVNTNGDPTERVHFEHDQNITVMAECNTSGSGKNAAYRLKSADSSSDWYMQTGNVTSGGLRWYDGNAGAERMQITSNGHVQITSGNLEFANGSGIDFSNVPDGSRSIDSDGNKLDDYEEGSFTPSLTTQTAALTASYTNQDGKYTKVGRYVYFQIYIRLSSKSGGSGQLRINGLPFTSSAASGAAYGGAVAAYTYNWAGNALDRMMIGSGSSQVQCFIGTSSGTNQNAGAGNLNNDTQMRIFGHYHV